jgi:hypothetical protein
LRLQTCFGRIDGGSERYLRTRVGVQDRDFAGTCFKLGEVDFTDARYASDYVQAARRTKANNDLTGPDE